jgi:hypothetical protein
MPWMPTSWRASFTSSSLKGLMIASTFFMGDVRLLAVTTGGRPSPAALPPL